MTDRDAIQPLHDEPIPLPPAAIVDQMVAPAPAKSTAAPARPVATLEFDPARPRTRTVKLDCPFFHGGQRISEITIRRLLTQEVAEIVDTVGREADQWDFFAVMTGLPAEVLRGLDGVDGPEVTASAYDFLPRPMRENG